MVIEKKVTAATLSASAVTVLIFITGQFGLEVPETVAAATVTLVVGVAGWVTPHTGRTDTSALEPGRHAAE